MEDSLPLYTLSLTFHLTERLYKGTLFSKAVTPNYTSEKQFD